ncbi:hypothetical protein DICPUDRAFT_159315 [Dictyostelium purpureum]|uniref:Uncharacterized protein n=1 Tax=Dictyostelium purpureum TaxID=5786 RepID=F1A3T7_DICPU|nr:uncharacterized protein DICPUDRAFT_159315 [Dictyostelium purpureum]EGC29139.1 hypothetical protein DICPUDRAFT_159315 [Dictyostelium purpureum]|eukprot:XP_003294331.1 hypothetical protein DICPUDRAFT_159315 [Dictyostelium purpureum]
MDIDTNQNRNNNNNNNNNSNNNDDDKNNDSNNDIQHNNKNEITSISLLSFIERKIDLLKVQSPLSGSIATTTTTNTNNNSFINNIPNGFCHIPKYYDALKIKQFQDKDKLQSKDIYNMLYTLFYDKCSSSAVNSILVAGNILWKDYNKGLLGVEILKIIDIYDSMNNTDNRNHSSNQNSNHSSNDNSSIPFEFDAISQYHIKATISTEEFSRSMLKDVNYYDVGDFVRAIIISIDKEKQDIQLSFDISRVSNIINNSSSNNNNTLYRYLGKYNPAEQFLQLGFTNIIGILERDPLFNNPWSCDTMCKSLSIKQLDTMIPYNSTYPSDLKETLRSHQNFIWSQNSVQTGIKYAKAGQFEKAIEYYKEALNVDHNHKDAYVALGAVYANNSQFEKAIYNFKEALSIDPNDSNADKYFKATLVKMKDSGVSMEECLKYIGPTSKSIGNNSHKNKDRDRDYRDRDYRDRNNKEYNNDKYSNIKKDKLKKLLQEEYDSDKSDKKKKKKRKKEKYSDSENSSDYSNDDDDDDNDENNEEHRHNRRRRSFQTNESSKSRSRERGKSESKYKDKSKDRDSRSRDRSRDRSKERSRDRGYRNKERSRSRSRGRRHKSRSRERKDKNRDRDRDRERDRDRDRDRERSRKSSKERYKDKNKRD